MELPVSLFILLKSMMYLSHTKKKLTTGSSNYMMFWANV